MKIEKTPDGYLLSKDICERIELWRRFDGVESWACEAIDELIAEREALRAKITEMERQEPIGTAGGMPGTTGFTMACFHADKVPIGDKLYALPGAQNVPSVPDATVLLRRAAMALEVVGTEWRESDLTLRFDLASALTVAPEAKP